jgi:hypothetical protein
MLDFSIMMLANEQPEAAIALYTESSDLKGRRGMGSHVVTMALGKWAEKDPVAALEWVKNNSEKHSDVISDQTKTAILAGAAKQDPKLALGMVKDLGVKEDRLVAESLARSARTPEERSALLQTLRSETKGELSERALNSLGGTLTSEGFESSQAWLTSAKLSEKETEAVAQGISYWQANADTGKWLTWMDGKVSEHTLKRKTDELVRQWTNKDYKAAGEWIGTLADGPTKTAAIKSYAKTVAPYEPEAARQWANSLPAGKERDDVLKSISEQGKIEAPDVDD